ncbi:CRIB domain-containing protein [Drosera capensis]
MTTRMKGFCKGFKYISHFFVAKEREMEIGYPTDVKHLAHIGWDGPDHGSAPSWMSEFKTSADFSVASVGSTWSSQDFELLRGRHPSSSMFSNFPPTNLPGIPKKQKRKKGKSSSLPTKSSSSPKSNSSRGSSRLSRTTTLHGKNDSRGLEL